MPHRVLLFVLTAALFAPMAAQAQLGQPNQRLQPGDTAPELKIDRWVAGDAKAITAGRVHMVIFWSASDASSVIYGNLWSAVQRILSDQVTVIGVTRDEDARVRQFTRMMEFAGSRVEYNIGIDQNSQTWRDWMERAGRTRLPTVFMIDKNQKIAYIGDPSEPNFFNALTLAIAGRYNEKLSREAAPLLQAADRERRLRNWRMFHKYMDEVIEKDTHVFNTVALRKFEVMLFDEGDTEAAYQYLAGPFKEAYKNDFETLGDVVVQLLTDARYREKDQRFKALALDLAKQCYEAAGTGSYMGMSVLALAHYHNGNYQEAVDLQARAWLLADPMFKEQFATSLEQYREAARNQR